MNFKSLLLSLLFILSPLSSAVADAPKVAAAVKTIKNKTPHEINTDEKALAFCKSHKNSFIAIIWPRAINYAGWIQKQLSAKGEVIYKKDFTLNNKGPYLFYKNAHRKINDSTIRNALSHYFKNMIPPYKCAAIVFESKESLPELVKLKEKIRNYVGIGYWSIHIVDNHKETIELGEWVLDDTILNKINA